LHWSTKIIAKNEENKTRGVTPAGNLIQELSYLAY